MISPVQIFGLRAKRPKSQNWYNKRRDLTRLKLLDTPENYWISSMMPEDEIENPKLFLLPEVSFVQAKKAALDMNADVYGSFHRSPEKDYEFINRAPEFQIPIPKEASWPRRKIANMVGRKDSRPLVCGQWISLKSIEWVAGPGRDRWFYAIQVQGKIRHQPGEWLYVDRTELVRIYPTLNIKRAPYKRRNVFLINVIRDDNRKPIELRVYSSGYKPLFKTQLIFKHGTPTPPEGMNLWWTDRKYNSSIYARFLAHEAQKHELASGHRVQ